MTKERDFDLHDVCLKRRLQAMVGDHGYLSGSVSKKMKTIDFHSDSRSALRD